MANPVVLVASVAPKLAEKAPDIIREVTPVTWFERVIHESHQYKLAKQELEIKYEHEKNTLKIEL